jgi:hypothetical protein
MLCKQLRVIDIDSGTSTLFMLGLLLPYAVRSVLSVAGKKKLLCREAFHYKEHPANKAVAQLLQVRPAASATSIGSVNHQ